MTNKAMAAGDVVVQAPVFIAGGVCHGLAKHEPIGAKSLLQKPEKMLEVLRDRDYLRRRV